MSSKTPRDPLDRDYTPNWAADLAVARIDRVLSNRPAMAAFDPKCPVGREYGNHPAGVQDHSYGGGPVLSCTCTHNPRTVWEPSCGGGAFVRAARRHWPDSKILATDIDPEVFKGRARRGGVSVASDRIIEGADGAVCIDILDTDESGIDLVLGNLAFKHAEEHLRHLFSQDHRVYAFVLRLGFLASAKRAAFWREHPVKQVHVFPRRIAFEAPSWAPHAEARDGKRTDSQDYALMIWGDVPPAPVDWMGAQ